MAQAEPRSDTTSGGEDGVEAGRKAYSAVEFDTDIGPASSSSELCQYVTAGISEVQISAVIEKSEEQAWSELADRAEMAQVEPSNDTASGGVEDGRGTEREASSSSFNIFRKHCVACGTVGYWTPRMWECDVCLDYFLCENCNKRSLEDSQVLSAPSQVHNQDHRMSPHATTYGCDGCKSRPILSRRWRCKVCFDFDLCEACYGLDAADMPLGHSKEHPMIAIEPVFGLENLLRFLAKRPMDPQCDEFRTASASTSSSSHESCKYVTAGMSELDIAAAIEKSKQQGWSEVADRARDGAGAASCGHGLDDQLLWEELKKRDPRVFTDWVGDALTLGRLIAEGGQAYIYEAQIRGRAKDYVAKVYKMEGFSLADLERQWPLATKAPPQSAQLGGSKWETVVGGVAFGETIVYCSEISYGTFLKGGRFTFVMPRYWGDLRTLINLKLSDNNSQGPPFPRCEALQIMREIADGMRNLHARGVLHRDLKAANVLINVNVNGDPRYDGKYSCDVADFESSMLVQGTGFWRASEVLEELLKRPRDRNVEVWTENVDIYSYAMTCYEVLTGHIPFYGYDKSDWKRVIGGERPHLPDYIDPKLQEVVERCWHKDPSKRSTFQDIYVELKNM